MQKTILILYAVLLCLASGSGVYAVESVKVNDLRTQVETMKRAEAIQSATNARDVAAIRRALETIK